ncbi:ribosome small subunit-dependent GTPase A [Desnuesiella massiliensis]|uniref:ribosome small subunit-dependent GTPase A n=1 Tax=Desnuesiella massiliensis TaxID=1650662 RepID=UPI0006E30F96|nr:ribosome small subunit-dependent GTPase A [Desnuesiella massiliensis]
MQGIIIKGIGGFYYVKTEDGNIFECKARGKFRFDELTPIVGDRVDIEVQNGKGVIDKIHERKSKLIRPLVANVNQAFVVFAVKNPDLNLELLNKFLVLCDYNNVKSILCLNKTDLCSEEEYMNIEKIMENLGYEVLHIRAKEGYGIDKLKAKLKDNITVLCGPSGVGKSTLLNSLIGKSYMETGEVSLKIGRGKHTTRHSELIEVEQGLMVDTPGFSTVDLSFIEKEQLQFCFPEFKPYLNNCRFSSCLHNKEPHCAVKEALNDKKINPYRYEFYIKTLEEISQGRNKKWQK